MQDGISDFEAGVIREFVHFSLLSPSATSRLIAMPWVRDDIDAVEADAIRWINDFGDPESGLLVTSYPWVEDGVSTVAEAEGIGYLAWFEREQAGGDAFLTLDWVEDGISDVENGLLREIYQLTVQNPTGFSDLLAQSWVQEGVRPDPVVRIVYAVPSDREKNPAYVTAVRDAALHVQDWYADQLGGPTFELADPTPETCSLPQPTSYYEREHGWNRILSDLQPCVPVAHDSAYYVWAIYPDVPFDCEHSELGRGGWGVTILHTSDLEGVVDGTTQCGFTRGKWGYVGGLAHELGHAFHLQHPPGCDDGLPTCDVESLMHVGYANYPDTFLREEDVITLKASPWFQSIKQ